MAYYDDIAPGYDNLHKEEQLQKLLMILDELVITDNDSLLDVGCGTAFSFEVLQQIGCRYQGLEPSSGLIEHSRYKTKITQGSAENIPFPDGFFSVVISITALQNFDDPKKGLQEIHRVCRDRAAISFLKRGSRKELFDQLIHEIFLVEKIIEEDRDLIYVVKHKNKSSSVPL